MNRAEVLEALRATGYTGPTSYTKTRLLEMLEERSGVEPPEGGVATPEKRTQGPRRAGKRTTAPNPDPFVRVDRWDGLDRTRDFRVNVTGGWFRFVAHVTNPETGESWVDCLDVKRRKSRCFRPEVVKRKAGDVIVSRPTQLRRKDEEDDG